MAVNPKEYPFIPKSSKGLSLGDFWSIPLGDDKYACGRVIQLHNEDSIWPSSTKSFLAGLMDWIGDKPPTFESIAQCGLIDQGLVHILTISDTGNGIDGNRPLDLDDIEPSYLKFPNATNSGWLLFYGLQYVRDLDESEIDGYETLSSWGRIFIRELAEHKLNHSDNGM